MYVSIPQSLLGFYIINAIMKTLLGEDWKTKVAIFTCWLFIVFIPLGLVCTLLNERDWKKDNQKELYLNARNNRVRANNKREDWDRFDFNDPTW